jgi:hypothetical protein
MPSKKLFVLLPFAASLVLAVPADADVNIGINVGPPPIVLATPPALVVVPGTAVSYAPAVDFNLFVFGGRYYSLHGGAWFHASTSRGPWTVIATEQVPAPVRAVPVGYYKIPPGHAKKMDGGVPPGHAKGHPGKKGKKGHDR